MGFMDRVKSTAQQVGDKAQEVGRTGQEKVEEARAKKKIEGLQRELGAIVYDQKTGSAGAGSDADVDRLVGEITQLRAQLDDGGDTGTAESGGDSGGEGG